MSNATQAIRELSGAVTDLLKVVRELAPGNVVDLGFVESQLTRARHHLLKAEEEQR